MDTIRLIYSYGSSDDLAYHGADQRGTASTFLLNPQGATPEMEDDVWYWDLLNDNVSHKTTAVETSVIHACCLSLRLNCHSCKT